MAMAISRPQRPVRVGVFESVMAADHAVKELLAAGFTTERISVVCSDRVKESLFAEYEHDQPAGASTAPAAGAGAVMGGLLAGFVAVTGVAGTGGVGLIIVGPLFAASGAMLGTFLGAMAAYGVEHEVANYYEQALTQGAILVAAEIGPDEDRAKLAVAEQVFEEAGVHPVALPRG